MGKHRAPEERLAHAEKLMDRNARAMERHRKRAKRFSDKGASESATKECQHYDRVERLHKKWQREVRKITKQIRIRDMLTQRAPVVLKTDQPVLSPSEQRQHEREQRAHATRVEDKRKKLGAASVEYDPRTAVGRRAYDVVNMGAKMRASLNHFNACVKRPADRTAARSLAWQEFDRHYHKIGAGLIASPRFEPGVDTSTTPSVSDARLDAMRDDHDLRTELGRDMHQLLIEVVYHQRSLRELEGLAYLGLPAVKAILLRALDLAAVYWRLDKPSPAKRRSMCRES